MSGNPGRIARRIHIKGKVQGVWYRGWTVDQANELGLDGWVRNRLDGSVEAVVAGPADKVEALIARCHEGPPAARVDKVIVEDTPGIVAAGFTQKATV
ncbi:acylphosphatase [Rhizorhabdus argentea]|uniref:acylphosphatase n=1 Tax=Rhizorhabdus argentea TaxID=1387174 RepID=UPI0030EEFCA7